MADFIPLGKDESTGQVRPAQTGDDLKNESDQLVGPVYQNHVRGARAAYATAATVTIGTAGQDSQAINSTNLHSIEWSGTLTADITASGAGGLDTGAEAASTWYAIHVIGDSTGANSPAAMLSLSPTAPTLPSGYDIFRRLGWVRNDASSNFLKFLQIWSGTTRRHVYDLSEITTRVLNSGSATSFTNVALSVFIPSTATNALMLIQFETGAAGSTTHELKLRPDGFTASATNSVWHLRLGLVNSEKQRNNIEIPCPGQIIEYRVDSVNNISHLSVAGYDDEI